MTPTLRPYQQQLVSDIRAAWSQGARNVMPVLPCGGGKTVIACELLEQHGGASVFIAHRSELLSAASLTLARYGLRHDIIGSADMKRAIAALHVADTGRCYFTPGAKCVVASVDTLIRRPDVANWAKQVTLFISDEGHHVVGTSIENGNKWFKAISLFTHPDVRGVLPTATAGRSDGRGLGRHADGIVDLMLTGPSKRELVEDGYLTGYKVYCPEDELHRLIKHETVGASGDWSPAQQRAASRKSQITGNVVASYKRWAWGKLNLAFTTDIETCADMAASYNAAGIPAIAITGTTDPHIRRQAFRRFIAREIWTIVTVDIVGEGTDVPACEVITEARLTQSMTVHRQHWGRGDRPMWVDGREPVTREARLASIAASNKPHAIYIDHTGCFLDPKLGPPDRTVQWTLDRRDKRAKTVSDAIPLRICLGCFQPFERILTVCPHCGQPIPAPTARSSPQAVEGDLAELDAAVLDRLRGEVALVDRTVEQVRQHYVQTGLPDIAVRGQIKHHNERTRAQGTLRDAMAAWGGIYHAAGENDRTIQRRFFWTFGCSTIEAQALGRADAEALRVRVQGVIDAHR